MGKNIDKGSARVVVLLYIAQIIYIYVTMEYIYMYMYIFEYKTYIYTYTFSSVLPSLLFLLDMLFQNLTTPPI